MSRLKKKRATITDIAREAGTSISTVSYVLNDGPKPVSKENRKKILDVVHRLSYTPDMVARGLKRRRTMSLGVIFPDMTNTYFPEILRGILEITQHEKYNIMLRNASQSVAAQNDCIRDLLSQRVDGFIIRPIAGSQVPAILCDSGIPFVVVDRSERGWKRYDSVSLNNRKAISTAVEMLVREGHESIALITGPRETGTSIERVNGFMDASDLHRLREDKCRVLYGKYSVETGRDSVHTILNENPGISAVVTASTAITFGAIQELRRQEMRISVEMSLVAYGYSKWLTLLFPPVTTIEQPVVEMGRRAVHILLQCIEKEDSGSRVREIIDPVIIDGVSHQSNF